MKLTGFVNLTHSFITNSKGSHALWAGKRAGAFFDFSDFFEFLHAFDYNFYYQYQ